MIYIASISFQPAPAASVVPVRFLQWLSHSDLQLRLNDQEDAPVYREALTHTEHLRTVLRLDIVLSNLTGLLAIRIFID